MPGDGQMPDEPEAARYCNFYEFSTFKDVWRSVRPFQPVPWTLEVTGLVTKPRTFDLDEQLKYVGHIFDRVFHAVHTRV